MLQRIEVNLQTGEQTVITLSPAEEAAAHARTAAEKLVPRPAGLDTRLSNLETWAAKQGYRP